LDVQYAVYPAGLPWRPRTEETSTMRPPPSRVAAWVPNAFASSHGPRTLASMMSCHCSGGICSIGAGLL